MTRTIRTFTPLGFLAMAACGPEGASTDAVSTGKVIKGPLEKALVFADANGNGVLDAGEAFARTDASGAFTLSNPDTYMIVVITDDTTIDRSSGQILSGLTMTGAADATVITPFTDLAASFTNTAALATALGLPSNIDFATFDPYAAGVDTSVALAYEQASQTIMAAAQLISAELEGSGAADAGQGLMTAFNSVVAQVAASADAGATSLDAAAITSRTLANLGITGAKATKLEGEMTAIAAAIEAVDSLDSDASTTAFAAAAIVVAGTGGTLEEILNLAPTDVTLAASTVDENEVGAVIGAIYVVDDGAANQAFTYTLSGADAGLFEVADGVLSLAAGVSLNFEEQSAYDVTIEVVDAGGKSITKTFTVTVDGINEATAGEADAWDTSPARVGDTLGLDESNSLYAQFVDEDNKVNGGGESNFASHSFQWMRGDEEILGATSSNYVLTKTDVAADITLQITLVDQQGGQSDSTVEFGPVFPDSSLVEVQLGADNEAQIEALDRELQIADGLLTDFSDNVSDAFTAFQTAVEASGATDPTYEVSSTGVTMIWGNTSIKAEFSNFNPTSLAQLQTFLDDFDIYDEATWTATGGFEQLSFRVESDTLVHVQFNANNNNGLDDVRIMLPNAPNGTLEYVALTGNFDNGLFGVIDTLSSLLEFGEDAGWEVKEDAAQLDLFGKILTTYDAKGLVAGTPDSNSHYINVNTFLVNDAGENVAQVVIGDYSLILTGEFPADAVAALKLIYGIYENSEETWTTPDEILSGSASLGFGGVTSIELRNDADDTTIIRADIDDFDMFFNGFEDITFDGHTMGIFTDNSGEEMKYAYDNDGLYMFTGAAAEIDAFIGDNTA